MCKPVTFKAPLPIIPPPPTQPTNGVHELVHPMIENLPPTLPSSPLSSRSVTPELSDTEDENRVDQVVQPIITNLPSRPRSRTVTQEISDADAEVVFMLFTPTKAAPPETPKTTPMDIDWVKKEMELTRTPDQSSALLPEMRYVRVIRHINACLLDPRGLLVHIFCNLIMSRHMQDRNKNYHPFNQTAAASLELLHQRLWAPNCAFQLNCNFMYLVGTAHLIINQNSDDSVLQRRTKNYFFKAAQLLKESSLPPEHPLRQKNLLGLSLACLYQLRHDILKDGINKKRARLIETLDESRKFLAKALKAYTGHILEYQMALLHCLTTLVFEAQQSEEKPAEADRLYKISEGHLKQAEKILNAIPVKTGNIRALLATIQYKNAFDHDPVRCYSGWESIEDLSEADSLLEGGDPLLRLALSDTLRQIAWAVPVDYMRYRFEGSLEKLTQETGDCKLLAESFRLVFNIQNALWQLIEYNKVLSDFQRQSLGTPPLDTSDLEFVDIVLLINTAKTRRDTLSTLRKQSHPNRMKNAGKDLRLLKEFAEGSLQDVAQLDLLFRSNFIQKDAYEELKNNAVEDLRVIEILKQVSLKLLRDNSFQNLRNSSAQLIGLLEKSKGVPRFAPIWYFLRKAQFKLEKKYLELTIFPDNPDERRQYVALIQKIGNKFDQCYTVTLFKEMLLERLKDYDYVLNPELHMV